MVNTRGANVMRQVLYKVVVSCCESRLLLSVRSYLVHYFLLLFMHSPCRCDRFSLDQPTNLLMQFVVSLNSFIDTPQSQPEYDLNKE